MIPRRIWLALCGMVALAITACEPGNRTISLGHSSEEPVDPIARAVRDTLSQHNFDVQLEVVLDPSDAIQAVVDGKLDLAIIEEPDRPLPDLMTLSSLYPSVLHILYRRGATADTLAALLDGASVYTGPIGGAANSLLLDLVADFGIPADSYRLLENPWTEEPDVFFILGGLLSPESAARLADYQLFSLAAPDDVDGGSIADGIALRHHHVRPFLIPKGVYTRLTDSAVLTLSTRTILIAREDFDEQLAFEIAGALFNDAQEISRSYPLVTRELTEDIHGSDLMLPLHAGTRRYQERDRPGFVERNVDLIALYLTVVLALLSGGVAFYRNRQQVKKDRIDVFYERLLSIRKSLPSHQSEDKAHRTEQRQRVLAVQEEVLELLVDERISADDSLVAFIHLSNQMLDELSR